MLILQGWDENCGYCTLSIMLCVGLGLGDSKLVYYKFMCKNKWDHKLETTGKIQLIRIYGGREDPLCY